MKLAIMQPYFIPYLGYFQLMAAVDRFVLLDDVNHIQRGWVNRNRILVGEREHLLTIPLRSASQNVQIRQLGLSEDQPWRARMLRTIEQAYARAPYYAETLPLVQEIVGCPVSELAPYLRASLERIRHWLDIPCDIVPSAAVYRAEGRKGAERILDICRREAAQVYVNPPGGRALYQHADFDAQGTRLRFLKPVLAPYPQGRPGFSPGLSIIDVLMHTGREATHAALFSAELE